MINISDRFGDDLTLLNLHIVWKLLKMSQLKFSILVISTIFGIFSKLLSTQIVNVASFARSVECDFFFNFQTLCICSAAMTSGVSTPLQESSSAEQNNPAAPTPASQAAPADNPQTQYQSNYFENNTNGSEAPGSPNGTNGTVNSTSGLNQYSLYG